MNFVIIKETFSGRTF